MSIRGRKKKKKEQSLSIWVSSNSRDWYRFETWAFYTSKVWTNETVEGERNVFILLLDQALPDLRRGGGVFWVGPGTDPPLSG